MSSHRFNTECELCDVLEEGCGTTSCQSSLLRQSVRNLWGSVKKTVAEDLGGYWVLDKLNIICLHDWHLVDNDRYSECSKCGQRHLAPPQHINCRCVLTPVIPVEDYWHLPSGVCIHCNCFGCDTGICREKATLLRLSQED